MHRINRMISVAPHDHLITAYAHSLQGARRKERHRHERKADGVSSAREA